MRCNLPHKYISITWQHLEQHRNDHLHALEELSWKTRKEELEVPLSICKQILTLTIPQVSGKPLNQWRPVSSHWGRLTSRREPSRRLLAHLCLCGRGGGPARAEPAEPDNKYRYRSSFHPEGVKADFYINFALWIWCLIVRLLKACISQPKNIHSSRNTIPKMTQLVWLVPCPAPSHWVKVDFYINFAL